MRCVVKANYKNSGKPNEVSQVAVLVIFMFLIYPVSISVYTPATVAGIFVVFLSPSRKIPEYLCKDDFLLHPFQLIVHMSSYN
jgi:hypothetical protein